MIEPLNSSLVEDGVGDAETTNPTKPVTAMTEDELVDEFRNLVEGIATKMVKRLKLKVDRQDLVAYGFTGLLEAYHRYDPSQSTAFSSFAYYRVRGAMFDGCRKEGWASRDRRTNVDDYAAINEHMTSQQETHSDDPPAHTLTESVDRVSNMVGDALTILMVRNSDLEDVLVQHEVPQDVRTEKKARNHRLTEAMSQLDETERALVKRHHYYDEPLSSIADELGLSNSWCSRIHARALEKLREILTSSKEDDDPTEGPLPTPEETRI